MWESLSKHVNSREKLYETVRKCSPEFSKYLTVKTSKDEAKFFKDSEENMLRSSQILFGQKGKLSVREYTDFKKRLDNLPENVPTTPIASYEDVIKWLRAQLSDVKLLQTPSETVFDFLDTFEKALPGTTTCRQWLCQLQSCI